MRVVDEDLADAERTLGWTWTDTGFRARLPTTPPIGPAFVAIALALALFGVLTLIAPEYAGRLGAAMVALLYAVGGIVAVLATLFVVSWQHALHMGWAHEDPLSAHRQAPAERARHVALEVDAQTLRIGRRVWPLAEIDHVLFVQGALRVRCGRERWVAPIATAAQPAVERVLVRFLDEAVARAKAGRGDRDRAERAARAATAALRSRAPLAGRGD